MYSCECYQIGGRFIAEDPDCPAHGTSAQLEAQEETREREAIALDLETALDSGNPDRIESMARAVLDYLRCS